MRLMPGCYSLVAGQQITGLPDKLRQARRKKYAVLACAGAYLQHMLAIIENGLKYLKNGRLIVLASLRKRQTCSEGGGINVHVENCQR